MADYNVQNTLWTDPATAVGLWTPAKRCWELSAETSALISQRVAAYTHQIEDIAGEIDQVQQRIDELPIDSPERPVLEAEKARLQEEMEKVQGKKGNLSAATIDNCMWKGFIDKRDVVSILENSVLRAVLMYNNPKGIRRDQYNTLSGFVPILSANQDVTEEKWCIEEDLETGELVARKKQIHPLSTYLSTVTSQIPKLSTNLVVEAYKPYFQRADATPYLETTTYRLGHMFFAKNALCALTIPSEMNRQAMPVMASRNSAGEYVVGLQPKLDWSEDTTLWFDNEKAFGGEISNITNIGYQPGLLESCGWGSNGRWISAETTIGDPTTTQIVKTGVPVQKYLAEWYSPRSRYLGFYGMPVPPVTLPTSLFYFDRDFLLESAPQISTIITTGEYNYETGEEISSFWGMFQPETPSYLPTTNNLKGKSANAGDIYTAYWNLSKMDTMAKFIEYHQDQIYWQIQGNEYVSSEGGMQVQQIALSDHISAVSNYEWIRKVNELDWRTFTTEFLDPYVDFKRKSNEQNYKSEQGCHFTGTAVGNWNELSGHYEHATTWYWNNMFDRYGEVVNVWFIVPVVGYSARWREWTSTVDVKTMVRFDNLDIKVSLIAVQATKAEDQATKSWKAYMGNDFWQKINRISWENCMPPAPPEPEFPTEEQLEINVTNSSMRRCKCLGPTMALVKYRWKDEQGDDGVHYLPVNLPAPKYTWEKPWEKKEESEGEQEQHQDEQEEQQMTPKELDETNLYVALNGGVNPECDQSDDVILLSEESFMANINNGEAMKKEEMGEKYLGEDELMTAMNGGINPVSDGAGANNDDFYFG